MTNVQGEINVTNTTFKMEKLTNVQRAEVTTDSSWVIYILNTVCQHSIHYFANILYVCQQEMGVCNLM
jgi:hypothetical protein